jgi:hypothetical protein
MSALNPAIPMNYFEAVKLITTTKNAKVRRTNWGYAEYLRHIDLYSDDHRRVSDLSDIKETLSYFIAKRDNYNRMSPYQFTQDDIMSTDWVEYYGP